MDTTDILMRIRKIVRAVNLESKKIQKEYGVSIPQVLCLGYLHQCENFQATQGEVRKYLNLNSSTASGIINRLEAKGLVARLPKSGDKRTVKLILTSKGFHLYKQIPSLLQDQLTVKLNRLDNQSLNQMHHSLELLVKFLQAENIDNEQIISGEDLFDDAGTA